MDGTIWVESHLGSGSSFQFTVHFLSGNEELNAQELESESVSGQTLLRPIDILLADDVEINRVLVQAIMEPYGHRITCAEDGIKAVELFQTNHFELVLMDVQMPEMDGLQATRAIRDFELSMNRTTPTPIIAMTAFAGSEDRKTCLDAGMNDYLSKPLKADHLLQLVNSYSERSKDCTEAPAASISEAATQDQLSIDTVHNAPVFAQSELVERLGGRTEMIPRLVDLFFKGIGPRMDELVAALDEEDAPAVKRITHAIKGTAGNISAHRIKITAEIMEKAAAAGDVAQASQHLADLQQEFQSFSSTVTNLGITTEPH
jgi:CheY-like chemotaxis protein